MMNRGCFNIEFCAGRGTHDRSNPHWVSRPYGTNLHVLEYTVSGRGTIHGTDAVFEARPGDFVLFRPGVTQEYGMDPKIGHWDHLWFGFTPREEWHDWLNWAEPSHGIGRLRIADPRIRRRLVGRMESAVNLANGSFQRRDAFTMNILEEIFLWCDTFSPHSAHARLDGRIRMALEHICTHYAERITLSGLAKLCCLSPSRFAHLFREQMGLTSIQYIEQQRIEHARTLLRFTSHPIREVAYRVGFNNAFYFSRVFKRATGKSPRNFRKSS